MPKQQQQRRRMVDGVIGACVLALLYLGYEYVHRIMHRPAAASRLERPTGGATTPPAQVKEETTARDSPSGTIADMPGVLTIPAKSLRGPIPLGRPNAQPFASGPITSETSPKPETAPVPTGNEPASGSMVQPRLTMPDASVPLLAGVGTATASPFKSARPAGRVPVVVPESTLNRQLDSPRLPAYASDPAYYDSYQRKYPRLLRRGTMPVYSPDSAEDTAAVAVMHTPEIPGVSMNAARPVSSGAMRGGVVRSACLGMMAGNLDYSPVPAYPPAAAAARVQGQVRIEATVDLDGSVTAARVISGPPLLREAALDAVQQWRYKPYVAAGKAKPAGTTAVLDFTLP